MTNELKRREFISAVAALAIVPALPITAMPAVAIERPLRMFTNGYDVLVHFSLDEAKKCLVETCGVTEEEAEGDGWRELPRSKVQGVEVDLDEPTIVVHVVDGKEVEKQVWSEVEKRPVGEWCDEYGPGYFAGYDY